MNLTTRDRFATLFVAAAVAIYGLWLSGVMGGLGPSAIAIVILVLGVMASASAVVPGFAALLTGSRPYLAITSLVGFVALATGILTVVNATEETLVILMIATLVLWAGATLRHGATGRIRGVAIR